MTWDSGYRHWCWSWLLLLGLCVWPVCQAGADAVLVQEAALRATVRVDQALSEQTGPYAGDNPSFLERAIAELREHLGLLGEGDLLVEHAAGRQLDAPATGQQTAVVLRLIQPDSPWDKAIKEKGDDPESFLLHVGDNRVTVAGYTPKGVLNGVYELLEQLGFRWYMPGEIGRVVPTGNTHRLAEGQMVSVPSFILRSSLSSNRRLPHLGQWNHRLRNSVPRWTVGHGIQPFTGRGNREYRESNPEWFALVNGERGKRGQLCVSHPMVLKMAVEHLRKTLPDTQPDASGFRIVGMTPQDGSGYCECDDCTALDPPHNANLQTPIRSITDRYIWFINQVLAEVGDEFPDLRIGFLIYAAGMDPPVMVKPDPRIFGSIAEIHVCRIHGPNNPNCPESNYLTWLMEQWTELLPVVRNSGYYFNLACPHVPFMMIHRMREEIPLLHRLGSVGISRAFSDHGPSHSPSPYVASRLNWDVTTDVDAVLDEFFHLFYGPAAEPMRQYTMLIDQALYQADHHTGRAWDFIHIYDESVRQQARAALDEAARLATEGLYAQRVELTAKSWHFFEAFAEVLETRNRHDFAASMQAVERTRTLIDSLSNDYEYPMVRLHPISTSSRRFFDLFFARVTEQAYARVTDGNQFIAGADPVWQFLLEPQGIGERIGLHDPANTGGNWQTINTHDSWGNQGLRYYYGQVWYKQTVDLPADHQGRRIMLWLPGIDNAGKIWLNGELLGTSPGAAFDIDAHGGSIQPFEFDVTDAVRLGEPNVITIRAARTVSNELGTGGLMGPVFFYAKAAEAK